MVAASSVRAGFTGHEVPDEPRTETPRVVVIGTGFAGLCMGIRLKRAGIESFTIYEKAGSIGGTWRDNNYPGAACDVQSHLYSFSFEKNPRWSRMFARQAEIRAYLDHCADKYDIRRHIQFNTEITATRFDESTSTWTVTLANGEEVEADIVVTASGGLSRPANPDIPGLLDFEGKVFHSARWDHDYSLEGKTVGVVGTGASSIQFVPQIAPRVSQLHLFQRTAPWILPKPDRAILRLEQWIFTIVPLFQWIYRIAIYWWLELRVLGFVVNPKIMRLPQRVAERYLARIVPDPVLREKLTPKYTIGCKRILISNDYYPALCRSNVEVVDTGIERVTKDGILTKDGRHLRLDALILGTGFEASESAAPFPITGRNRVSLADQWEPGAEAYLGTSVAGFPNFFFIVGPNSGLGHSSMVFMIESQVEHIMQALAVLRKAEAKSIEVRRDVQRTYNEGLHARLQRTVWASGCTSWYRTRSGKNTTLWPEFTFTFRRLTGRAPDAAYLVAAQPVVPAASSGKNSVGAPARPAPPLVSHAET